ncbi:MAG: CDP-glycerol glycerophosphotransferase family protein [Candidatus Marinimicrobia bacterium]|nr:CDP-glycerol glycerophosphotransferase family protein [Candidatus Neomarinimicrobiota bacterium]
MKQLDLKNDYIIAIDIPFNFLFQYIKNIYYELYSIPGIKIVFIVPVNNPSDPRNYLIRCGIDHNDIISYPHIVFSRVVDIFFTPANSQILITSKKTKKVIYAHTLAGWGNGKSTYGIENILNYDYIFTTGLIQEKVIDDYFMFKKNITLPPKIPIGYTLGDSITGGYANYNKNELLQKRGLKPNNITVIYAPSWGETASFRECGFLIIEELCSNKSLNVLVKLHPALLYGSRKAEKNESIIWLKELNRLGAKYENLLLMENDTNFHSLFSSDIMITDISGVGFEFLLLRKPVIYFDVPNYFKKFGIEGPEFWARKGIIVKKVEEIKDAINMYIKKPGLYINEVNNLIPLLIHNPNNATKTAVQALLKILNYRTD